MEATIVSWGYLGIMENEMETTIVYGGYIRIMEKNMKATIFKLNAGYRATEQQFIIGVKYEYAYYPNLSNWGSIHIQCGVCRFADLEC